MTVPRPTMLHFHVPKTAGTSMASVIRRNYDRDEIYEIRVRSTEASARFKAMSLEKKARYRAITGHISLDFREHVPGKVYQVTLLREPVQRALSTYSHVLRHPDHEFHSLATRPEIGVREFIESGSMPMLDNGQTRVFSGVGLDVPFGACTAELLREAKHNLETKFAVVGIAQRFDETLMLIGRSLGWRRLGYVRRNVDRSCDRSRFGAEIVPLLREHNRLDAELYRWACERLERRTSVLGSRFAVSLLRLRTENFVRGHAASRRSRGRRRVARTESRC